MSEKAIQNAILAWAATRPDIRLWRNNAGVAIPLSEIERKKKNPSYQPKAVRYGVNGQADLSGVIKGSGRRLEVEVKTFTGKQSEDQKKFERMITGMNGLYVLARCPEDLEVALEGN